MRHGRNTPSARTEPDVVIVGAVSPVPSDPARHPPLQSETQHLSRHSAQPVEPNHSASGVRAEIVPVILNDHRIADEDALKRARDPSSKYHQTTQTPVSPASTLAQECVRNDFPFSVERHSEVVSFSIRRPTKNSQPLRVVWQRGNADKDFQFQSLPPALAGGSVVYCGQQPALAGLHSWLQPVDQLRDGKSG